MSLIGDTIDITSSVSPLNRNDVTVGDGPESFFLVPSEYSIEVDVDGESFSIIYMTMPFSPT